MPDLREYQERVAPMRKAAPHRTVRADDHEEPARLPSLLQHAQDANIPSSSPAGSPRSESPTLSRQDPTDPTDVFASPSSRRGTPAPHSPRAPFFPSPVSSPDLPNGLDIVRRHWASKYPLIKGEEVQDESTGVAGPSRESNARGKRRARSSSVARNVKRPRQAISGEGSARPSNPSGVVKTEGRAIDLRGDVDDVIDLSDEDHPHATHAFGAHDVIELSDDEAVRVERVGGIQYIVISDDE